MDVTRQSLLVRAQAGDEAAWDDLTSLYRPLILAWLRRQGAPPPELDDLAQEVLLAVVKALPSFQHSGRCGAFRAWLRTIVCQRTCDYWRASARRDPAQGGSAATEALLRLESPESDLNRQWDEEHDRYVLRYLLELAEQEFEARTAQAFRRLALDGASGAAVANELGLSVAAVYVAKSRVLQRLRQEAAELLD